MSNESDSYLNADLGEDYKDKLREIAEEKNRDMTNQIRTWIDREYSKVVGE
ncbi:hypothetical protein SAMN05443574_103267 [Haloarcula vallismortis]|uniref:Uncharacterized protein n=1 Tax=Haloarcula vallismortis TaxID=28442 RepID=A0A1H2TLL2_HALVA|nr:hypothetical protein [Haloarcula vallismortis]SDW44710.1 hypothetical protein SAMN05443574_103267 [Haloarcula vallismortis]